MTRRIGAGLVLALSLSGTVSWGQVVERERDVKITGPRGRTIERSITTERGPGFVDRQVNVQRPGGSFHSNVMAQRIPGRPAGPMPGPHARGFMPPPPRWGYPGPRTVVVNNGGGGIGLAPALIGGAGLFGLGMLTGSAISSPPPPAPVYVAAPPTVVVAQPQPYSPAPPPAATVVVDPVADAIGRLQSHHSHSRRDGCITLGRLRDPRGVAPLVDRLKNDWTTEVREAAAIALGEIGDPRAIVYLEKAVVYDKKEDVRDAAKSSLTRFTREISANAAPAGVINAPPASAVPSGPIENVPPPPSPAYTPGFGSNP